jgi:peptidase E
MVSLRRHLRKALSEVACTRKPLVAYVGAASGDDAGFQGWIGGEIERAGGRVVGVKLASPRAKLSSARAVLEGCDVVFVSGGDVHAGMNVLKDRGVLPLFHALGREGRPMIGISAGSIMLGRAWVRFPEDESPKKRGADERASLFECLGIAPVHVDAHAEEDNWAELRVLLRLLAAVGEARPVGYGLTCKGGVLVEPAGDGTKLSAFGTDAPRFVASGGRVAEAASLALGASTPVPETSPSPRRRAPAR